MTTKIVISPSNTKAIAFFQKLHEKKKEVKKQMEQTSIAKGRKEKTN